MRASAVREVLAAEFFARKGGDTSQNCARNRGAVGEDGGMGRTYDEIDERLVEWLGRQAVFFVATAPGADGHVNLSPKGLDTFRVLGPHRVAYLDLTGSGVETIAHLRVDGRITFMFCAFEGAPRIVRLFGRG